MHDSSFAMMGVLLDKHRGLFPKAGPLEGRLLRVADVGAADINGTYRPLIAPWANYVGIDLAAGPNVDLVAAPYEIPGGPHDVILCGQVLEHTEDMLRLVKAIREALVPGGVCFLTAPNGWPEHRYPIDCWRLLADGMDWLLRGAELEKIEIFYNGPDTWAVGRRPC